LPGRFPLVSQYESFDNVLKAGGQSLYEYSFYNFVNVLGLGKMTPLAQNLNDAMNKRYVKMKYFGELAQLSRLFDNSLMESFSKIINEYYVKANPRIIHRTDVAIGWIDKHPYADFKCNTSPPKDINGNDITARVELGDAALFFQDEIRNSGKTCTCANAVMTRVTWPFMDRKK
jgi:hypothetical protein